MTAASLEEDVEGQRFSEAIGSWCCKFFFFLFLFLFLLLLLLLL